MLQTGSTTATTTAAMPSATASRLGIAPPRREEPGRPPLQEEDDAHEDRHLAEHRAERGLDALGQAAEAGRGQDRPGELANAAGDDHHEGVHEVVLAERLADVADLGERAAGQTREPRSEGDRGRVRRARAQAKPRADRAV